MTSPIFGQVLPNLGVKLTSVYYLFCLFPGVFTKRLQYCEDLDESFDVKATRWRVIISGYNSYGNRFNNYQKYPDRQLKKRKNRRNNDNKHSF